MAPMVFMNEISTAGRTNAQWTEPGNMAHAQYNFISISIQLAVAGKTSRVRLAAQLAVSVQRVRAQRGLASGPSF